MKKEIQRGVLIIAVGHANYLAMATNLAASIRVNDPGLQIALATDYPPPAWLQEKKLIDINVQVPKSFTSFKNQPAFIKAKVHMYELSPFKETIFLDADQILIDGRQLSPVFDELKDVELTFSNTGKAGGSMWADIEETKSIYGDKPFWNFHSEFVFFREGKAAADYFKAAQKVFSDNKIKSATVFGSAPMADELAFQCAAMITGLYPHKENWLPNFWYARDSNMSRKYVYQLGDRLTYSIGGHTLPEAVKRNYNILAKSYFAILGLVTPYLATDKKSFLPERQKI